MLFRHFFIPVNSKNKSSFFFNFTNLSTDSVYRHISQVTVSIPILSVENRGPGHGKIVIRYSKKTQDGNGVVYKKLFYIYVT